MLQQNEKVISVCSAVTPTVYSNYYKSLWIDLLLLVLKYSEHLSVDAFFLVSPIAERLCTYLSCFVSHLQSYKVCFVSDFVPNTSDDERRYSYKNQPHVALFNLEKLRVALASLLDPVE